MDINIYEEESLENGINFLIDRFSDVKSFLADIQLPEYGDYFEYPFPISCNSDKQFFADLEFGNKNETAFYASCIKANKQEDVANIISLIIDLNKYIKQNFAADCIWENNEIPFGLVPASLLAKNDSQYIDLFIEFLNTNDLEVETFHFNIIRNIVEHHGWTDNTLKLAFYRATTLCGQRGLEQLDHFLSDMDLDAYLTSEEGIQNWFALKTSMPEDEIDDVLEMVDMALRDMRAYEDQKSEGFDNQLEDLNVFIISQNWFDTFKEAVIYVRARGGTICKEMDENTNIAISTELDWPEALTAKAESMNILRIWKTVTTRKEAKETLKRIYDKFEDNILQNDRAGIADMLIRYPELVNDYYENAYIERLINKHLKSLNDIRGLIYIISRHRDRRWLYETLVNQDIEKILGFIEADDEISTEFINQALFIAIADENEHALNKIFTLGVNLHTARAIGDQAPMEWAFWSGNAPNYSIIETLLKHGANPNEKNAKGKTPLMFAISKIGQTNSSFAEWKQLIDLLLLFGADIQELDKQGNSVYDYAKTLATNSHGILKTNVEKMIDSIF